MPNHRSATTRICPGCGESFLLNQDLSEGRRVHLHKRRYCLACVPPGTRDAKKIRRRTGTRWQCGRCGEEKPNAEFYTRSRGGHTSTCKPCHDAEGRLTRQRYKAEAVAYKGGCCQRCGYRRHLAALEFHHPDPSKKDFSISGWRRSFASMKSELDKCHLLCGNCHREEHVRLDRVEEVAQTDPTGPRCSRCGLHKDARFFTQKAGRPGSWCKHCFRVYQQESRSELKQEIIAYKGGCCERCGYDRCSGALELHHRDFTQKDFSLSEIRKRLPLVRGEVDKCVLLCTNCHRERHHEVQVIPFWTYPPS